MVKRRQPPKATKATVPSPEAIEAFAAGADRLPDENVAQANAISHAADPSARRDYKAIRVPFNEYEFSVLEAIAKQTGRTKLNTIRWAILQLAESAEKESKSDA